MPQNRFPKVTEVIICFLLGSICLTAQNPVNENPAIGEGRYFALLIGINDYSDPQIADLTSPVKSAEKLSQILKSKYVFNNVNLLPNPDKAEIEEALDNFVRTINPIDNLLIFYCGHGGWDESSGSGYWIPSDAQKENHNTQISSLTLLNYIRDIKSRHTLLIVDAGFAGSVFSSRSEARAPENIKELYDLPGRKAMTSTTLTDETPDQNIFSQYLIDRLNS